MNNRELKNSSYINEYTKNNPKITELAELVQDVIKSSSWWQRYGIDWTILLGAFAMLPVSFYLLASTNWLNIVIGSFIFGVTYSILAQKGGHSATHHALAQSAAWNDFWTKIFIEFVGAFSVDAGCETHIKLHHMHTNVIGLGDSSIWKAPHIPRTLYMFFIPIFIPLITPVVAIGYLWGQWRKLLRSLPLMIIGLVSHYLILHFYCGYSISTAFICLFLSRAIMAVPYIHVNIFQHIGLPMYLPEDRPASRIHLMSSSVLNLHSHPLLDLAFGHSIISCHVEHHLFPHLSDNMCLKIKPLVSSYLKDHGLTYHETSYWERLNHFLNNFKKLMVDPIPITKFVGIQ